MGGSASVAPGAAPAAAFAILSQLGGAVFLYALLRVEGGWQVAALLGLLGFGFIMLERFPWIGDFAIASLARVPLVTIATAATIDRGAALCGAGAGSQLSAR